MLGMASLLLCMSDWLIAAVHRQAHARPPLPIPPHQQPAPTLATVPPCHFHPVPPSEPSSTMQTLLCSLLPPLLTRNTRCNTPAGQLQRPDGHPVRHLQRAAGRPPGGGAGRGGAGGDFKWGGRHLAGIWQGWAALASHTASSPLTSNPIPHSPPPPPHAGLQAAHQQVLGAHQRCVGSEALHHREHASFCFQQGGWMGGWFR